MGRGQGGDKRSRQRQSVMTRGNGNKKRREAKRSEAKRSEAKRKEER